jgi:hypothetical protein
MAALMASVHPAWAALGEPATDVPAEAAKLGAAHRLAFGATSVQHLQWSDGSQVRQYAGSDGRVYAVSWASRGKPQLPVLLGSHYDRFAAAARQDLQQRPGVRHSGIWRDGDLVVEQTANADAFVGRAYLSSKLPSGQRPDAIR